MKILLVTPFITTGAKFGNFVHTGGGVAVRYENYEKQLKAAGHETRVLCPDRRTVDTWVLKDSGYITSNCMKGYPINALTPSNILRLVHCFRWCDVVVCPENEHMMSLAFFSKVFRKRMVINVHTNVHQMLSTRPTTLPIFNFVYHQFLRTALCSSRVKCYTVSETNGKLLRENGVEVSGVYELNTREEEVEHFTEKDKQQLRQHLAPGVPKSTPVILFAGRWLEEKRVHRLVSTLPSSAALVIVGDGPLDMTHYNNNNIFVHKGFLPNDKIYACFLAVDWVANASDFETFGNTSYEANSVGVPCILQPAGGHLSQISNPGTNGHFVDFDRPDEEVRSHLESFVHSPPSAEIVKMNIVRKSDAVTILDVIDPASFPKKPHEMPFESKGGDEVFRRGVLIARYVIFETVFKFAILFVGCLFNVVVVGTVAALGGVTQIKADSYQDRLIRVKMHKKRKRDKVIAFLRKTGKQEVQVERIKGAKIKEIVRDDQEGEFR
ncbi:hypothetical protein TrVE_jg11046 [Triparma verrucosa]|uniref:Glycosyl transferase family 1 domain-containing protein n=1 Tax=Triparma verrucosa TaxID=1606542 RepID=A0A9W7BYH2_9STRA|nr:hypothetical protein TrVE_jg11046 [Triparma verrucosa]